jgi:hypothetical protein
MGANYAWGGYWSWDCKETWLLIVWLIYGAYIRARIDQQAVIREIVSGPRDWTRLDRLQVLTKWLNVSPKAAGAVQLDRGTRKG